MAWIDRDRAKRIQTYLKDKGVYKGDIDAKLAEKSEQAIYALGGTEENSIETLSGEPKTAHFCLAEFKCKDGTKVPKELWGNVFNLMLKLEELRAELCRVYGGRRAIYINSAYRHYSYNCNPPVNSKPTSQHIPAKAADIRVDGLTPKQVYIVADRIFADGGVGIYDTFVHVDIRNGKARWDKR